MQLVLGFVLNCVIVIFTVWLTNRSRDRADNEAGIARVKNYANMITAEIQTNDSTVAQRLKYLENLHQEFVAFLAAPASKPPIVEHGYSTLRVGAIAPLVSSDAVRYADADFLALVVLVYDRYSHCNEIKHLVDNAIVEYHVALTGSDADVRTAATRLASRIVQLRDAYWQLTGVFSKLTESNHAPQPDARRSGRKPHPA